MRYYVTLDFKRGPSYSGYVWAYDQQGAKQAAHHDAMTMGFLHPVKKAAVTEISVSAGDEE